MHEAIKKRGRKRERRRRVYPKLQQCRRLHFSASIRRGCRGFYEEKERNRTRRSLVEGLERGRGLFVEVPRAPAVLGLPFHPRFIGEEDSHRESSSRSVSFFLFFLYGLWVLGLILGPIGSEYYILLPSNNFVLELKLYRLRYLFQSIYSLCHSQAYDNVLYIIYSS